MMNESKVHTSVVIELANQEETEDHKTYQINFNEAETPKDYIIDQIFCGENITVYALFDIPEMNNKKSENELLKIQNSTMNDEYRFIHQNSFKKVAQRKPNRCHKQISVNASNEDLHFLSSSCSRDRSFHCLKHLGDSYEIPTGDESERELKVLFQKDVMSKVPNLTKFKAVSKGVNTDIAQSPKLLDEVQRAIACNFSYGKSNEKVFEIANLPSDNPCDAIDTDARQSFSTLSSDAEIKKCSKKTSPDFLFVPLLMMEDKFVNVYRKEKHRTGFKERGLGTKAQTTPTKVSLGINTDRNFSNETFRSGKRGSAECEGSVNASSDFHERKHGKSSKNAQTYLKKKDKDTILNEIKKLQGKLNALIKSIEFNDIYLSTNDDEELTEAEREMSQEVVKNFSTTLQPFHDSKSLHRNLNKFDEIPIFSPLTFPKKGGPSNSKKTAENVKVNNDLVKSYSSDFVPPQENTAAVQEVCEEEKPKIKPKNICSGINIDWELKASWKSVGVSKSDTNNRSNFFVPKYNCVKKSMSFDLKDDKVEMFCLKKMKNSSFKFEGSLKANMRIIQNGEAHLGDNLTSIIREMGDEAKRKLKISKTLLPTFNQDFKKDDVACLANSKLNLKKNLNEEEGDAKLIYPKQNFVQHPAILYCSANAIVSDGLLKSMKSVNVGRGKTKVVKTEEPGAKASSDPEKPTTSYKTCRKTSATDSEVKKEVKIIKKLSSKNKNTEKKSEKKEVPSNEATKPKFLSGARKYTVKGTPESKLHVDKLIKKVGDNEVKLESAPAANTTNKVRPNSAEKQGAKTERALRPCSRKRDLRENAPDTTAIDRKEVDKKVNKKKSPTALEIKVEKKSSDFEMQNNKKDVLQEKNPSENSSRLYSNPSSVVVELLSKKPTSMDEFCTNVSYEPMYYTNELGIKSEDVSETKGYSGSEENPIVKSVWALTKVLLYEDGTKKLEVLEASLTPPGYSLKP